MIIHRINCKQCGASVTAKSEKKEFCSDKCRKKYKREYNAGSITFHEEKFDPIMDWRHAENWAAQYNTPIEWLERAIKYCRLAGESPQYVEDRYLKKIDIPINREIDRIARAELCQQETV